ncbi:MAG: hypothetical protein U0Q22_12785 [Acidimicrobiales bacterium]
MTRRTRRSAAILTALTAFGMVATGCGSSDSADDATTTSAVRATTAPPATTTTASVTLPTTSVPVTTPGSTVAPIAVDPSWVLFDEPFFVWGVAAGDTLRVRDDAGVSHAEITRLSPGQRGIRVYDQSKPIGREVWRPVQVGTGVGWVNARFLRPVGPDTPTTTGTSVPAVAAAAATVAKALRDGDVAALAAVADPTRGVTFSPHAFVADDAPRLTRAQLAAAPTDRTKLLWGYTDGEGAPIRATIATRLRDIGGSTALTSTTTIGFDVRVHTGNSIDNIAARFPGDRVVEYHFAGTSRYRDFDWTSVRLVFDATGSSPKLVAIVEDTWTI